MKPPESRKLSPAAAHGDDRDRAKADDGKRAVGGTQTSVLLDDTSRWLASLPANVRPLACARKFPRIVNRIADVWRRVRHCQEYLDCLMRDERGNCAGFPLDVAKELLACAATMPISIRKAIRRGSSSNATTRYGTFHSASLFPAQQRDRRSPPSRFFPV
jgi:hypothetical protein